MNLISSVDFGTKFQQPVDTAQQSRLCRPVQCRRSILCDIIIIIIVVVTAWIFINILYTLNSGVDFLSVDYLLQN